MKLILLLICVLLICAIYMKYSDNNREMFEGSMFYRNREDNPIYIDNLPITNKPDYLVMLMDMDHRLYFGTCITNSDSVDVGGIYKLCYDENGVILFTPNDTKIILDSEFVSKLGDKKDSMMYIEPDGNIIIRSSGGELIRNTFNYSGRDNYPYMIAYDTIKNILGLYDKNWILVTKLSS